MPYTSDVQFYSAAWETMMPNVQDVAAYILNECGEMTAMKLQKLVYYSQAWSLVWDERPLFNERIEAWANGPVCPVLYDMHRGMFNIQPNNIPGNINSLDKNAKKTILAVIKFYGKKSAQWLSSLTHSEDPWVQAREGIGPGERGSSVISHASMAEYYSSL